MQMQCTSGRLVAPIAQNTSGGLQLADEEFRFLGSVLLELADHLVRPNICSFSIRHRARAISIGEQYFRSLSA